MNQGVELYDTVIYYKGRVWTIYALSGNQEGVFAYQGLKPYETFKYDTQSNRNITYLKMDVALNCIVEGEDRIAECVKNEKIAQAKNLGVR